MTALTAEQVEVWRSRLIIDYSTEAPHKDANEDELNALCDSALWPEQLDKAWDKGVHLEVCATGSFSGANLARKVTLYVGSKEFAGTSVRSVLNSYLAAPPAQREAEDAADSINWTEDASHENGNYANICGRCLAPFVGHKRRWACKRCATAATPPEPPALPTKGIGYEYISDVDKVRQLERALSDSQREVERLELAADDANLSRIAAEEERELLRKRALTAEAELARVREGEVVAATVAEVYQNRYTLEWNGRDYPQGTKLYVKEKA